MEISPITHGIYFSAVSKAKEHSVLMEKRKYIMKDEDMM